MTKDTTVYLLHILDCIGWIKEFVQPGKEWFFKDRKTQDAVTRNLEIIGQAVKDIGSDALAKSHPDIPWAQISATRNVLAHQYLGVDNDLLWNIIERELPQLERAVAELLDVLNTQQKKNSQEL